MGFFSDNKKKKDYEEKEEEVSYNLIINTMPRLDDENYCLLNLELLSLQEAKRIKEEIIKGLQSGKDTIIEVGADGNKESNTIVVGKFLRENIVVIIIEERWKNE